MSLTCCDKASAGSSSFAEYLAQLRRSGSALNLAWLRGPVRTWVMGETRCAARVPDEIERMAVIREAMDAGVVGLASFHQPGAQRRGRRAHAAARLASDAEHLALIEAMASRRRRLHGHQGRAELRRCWKKWPQRAGRR